MPAWANQARDGSPARRWRSMQRVACRGRWRRVGRGRADRATVGCRGHFSTRAQPGTPRPAVHREGQRIQSPPPTPRGMGPASSISPRSRFTTGWSRRSTSRSLKAIRSSSWNDCCGHSGSAIKLSAASGLVGAERHVGLDPAPTLHGELGAFAGRLPPCIVFCVGRRIRTGHKNVTPCRLIAVKIVAQVVSPCSAAYNVGVYRDRPRDRP